jgi:hypothetical protein
MSLIGTEVENGGLDHVLAWIRNETARSGPIEGLEALLRAVENSLREMASEAASARMSVSVHVGVGAVAVEIIAGSVRDWFHLC